MNHSTNLRGQSPRVVDYFVVIGAEDAWTPLPPNEQPAHQWNPRRLRLLFQPTKLSQYPAEDRRDVPFPAGIPLFCFPNGLEVLLDSKSPTFFSFVQTSDTGSHILGCCLVIYEPITSLQRANLKQLYLDLNEIEVANKIEASRLFVPKCLCFISTWPFVEAFKKLLCQLYRISLSPSLIPIERYLCNIVDDVPAPPPGRVEVVYYMGETAVTFRCPAINTPHTWASFPLTDIFECLQLDNFLTLVCAVLAERQVVFVSSQYSLLTSCAEAVNSLLYPLRWSHVYIPILPRALLGVLAAPVPFIVGLHISFLSSSDCVVPEEAVTVFLDENRIDLGSLGPPPALPEGRMRKLVHAIAPIVNPVFTGRLEPWKTIRLPTFDSAFSMAVRPDRANGTLEQGKSKLDEVQVREAFLRFFVAIMRTYRKYLIYPTQETPNPLVNFRAKQFIQDHPAQWAHFLATLLKTQAFSQFCDARISSNSLRDYDIRFFDESIDAKLNRYTFRLFRVDTPFLNDQSSKHFKTVVAPSPNLEGLSSPPEMLMKEVSVDRHIIAAETSPRGAVRPSMLVSVPENEEPSGEDPPSHLSEAISEIAMVARDVTNSMKFAGSGEAHRNGDGASETVSAVLTSRDSVQKRNEAVVLYSYDAFPLLDSTLFSPPRDTTNAYSAAMFNGRQQLTGRERTRRGSAPVKSNEIINEMLTRSLKRVPKYSNGILNISDDISHLLANGEDGRGFFSSLFKQKSTATMDTLEMHSVSGSNPHHLRKPGGAVQPPTAADAMACTYNSFITLVCFVISKSSALPAVRRAPPSTTQLIDEYGKGKSDSQRLSVSVWHPPGRSSPGQMTTMTSDTMAGSDGDASSVLEEHHETTKRSSFTTPSKTSRRSITVSDVDDHDARNFKNVNDNMKEEGSIASKAGLKIVFEILRIMTEKGLEPDELSFRSMAEACSVCGDGHCAIDLLEHLLHWNYLPDTDIANSVVQAMLHSMRSNPPLPSERMPSNQPRVITAKDVLDAVSTNTIDSLRIMLGPRKEGHKNRIPTVVATKVAAAPALAISPVPAPPAPNANAGEKSPRGSPRALLSPTGTSVSPPRKGAASNAVVKATKPREFFLASRVPPPSSKLATHLMLADRILDMQFPDLEINLHDVYGTFCPNYKCGKSQTLDQIREGWGSMDTSKYTTKCYYCEREFVPRFTVHSTAPGWMQEDPEPHQGAAVAISAPSAAPAGDALLWCELLSPWVLRKELLLILVNDGIDAMLSAQFRRACPKNSQNAVIFWNMIVAYRALGLPYSFLVADTLSTAFLTPLGADA